ncbi:MAG: hypothetical protein AAF385_13780 [Pseudomonadota bacterium]
MKYVLAIVLFFGAGNATADLQLADTDVEQIVELAHAFMPGDISAISPRNGRYRGYDPRDGNVTGYVYVSVQTSSGVNGLIIAKVDGSWQVTPSLRQRLRERAYRQKKRREAAK